MRSQTLLPPLSLVSMRGDEVRVIMAFADWLQQNGWTVKREVDFVDVYAERGTERQVQIGRFVHERIE